MAITNEKLEEIDRLWNSYFFPNTETLRNKLNIYDKEELQEKEAEITFERLVELYENFDEEHWKQIHRYIFGDLYDWAGEYRYVNMQKETGFTDVTNIEYFLNGELKLMNAEINNIYSVHALAAFLAEYYAHLMAIHPFREGNTRTVVVFAVLLAKHLGYEVDHELFKANSSYVRNALVWGSQGIYSKYEYLEKIFFDAILHENDESDQETVSSKESKYEKIGDYKVKDYVERPHEYKK